MKTNRTIRNCKDDFAFVCPKSWDSLQRTDRDSVRHCQECKEMVYLVRTDEETIERARAGQCIAREIPDASELPVMFLGRPKDHFAATPSQERAEEEFRRERSIDRALVDFKYSRRTCPGCGYPMPDWKRNCTVCGIEIGRAR